MEIPFGVPLGVLLIEISETATLEGRTGSDGRTGESATSNIRPSRTRVTLDDEVALSQH